ASAPAISAAMATGRDQRPEAAGRGSPYDSVSTGRSTSSIPGVSSGTLGGGGGSGGSGSLGIACKDAGTSISGETAGSEGGASIGIPRVLQKSSRFFRLV